MPSLYKKSIALCATFIILLSHPGYASPNATEPPLATENKPVDSSKSPTKDEEPKEEPIEELEPFIITGSRISQIDFDSVSPIYSIDAEQIEESGVRQVSDLIRQLPVTAGPSEADQIGSFAGDGAQANLRGTGIGGTLVLLNGRRLSPYALSSARGENFVDLNSIPVAAIERVEILRDGGSAIYGSDALAGVINFILRKDFEGLEINTFYGNTTDGLNASTRGFDLSWGKTTEKSSFLLFTNFFKRNSLMRRDRSFSKSSNHSAKGGFDLRDWASYPGFFEFEPFDDGTFFTFYGDGKTAEQAGYEKYNQNTRTTAIPETERRGFTFATDHQLNNNVEIFTEFSIQANVSNAQFAPAATDRDFIIPASNPYNPTRNIINPRTFFQTFDSTDIRASLVRPTDSGPRTRQIESDSGRFVLGLQGQQIDSIDWETSYVYGQSKVSQFDNNLIRVDLFQDALNASGNDALNPFASGPGENNNAEIYRRITTNDSRTAKKEFHQINADAGLDLFEFNGRTVSAHFGGEIRHESMDRQLSDEAEQFLFFGSGGTSAAGNRNIYAGYAEFAIPITSTIETQIAVRREEYSDFGGAFSPKIGIKFRPNQSILFRASVSDGFQAPSLEQAYGGTTRGFALESDLVRSSFTSSSPAQTDAYPFDDFRPRDVRLSGNPDLDPERSRHYNVGVVFSPKKFNNDLTFGLDFWRLEIDDIIATETITGLLLNEGSFYDQNPVNYLFGMTPEERGAITGVFRGPNEVFNGITIPGKLNHVVSRFDNFPGAQLDGVDFEAVYHHRTETWGNFWVRTYNVYIERFVQDDFDLVGFVGIPEFQSHNAIQWLSANRNYAATLSANYTSSYKTEYNNVPKVDSLTTYDFRFTYSGIFDTEIALDIQNIFDTDPPANLTKAAGYDTTTGSHSPLGRFISLSVKRSF